MNFALSDDHIALRDMAQNFLSNEVKLDPLLKPGADVTDAGYADLWAKIVELGWPAMVIPEEHGGLGMDYIDLVMVISEIGRTLAPSPLFGTLAGAWAIEASGDEAQKNDLLGKVASGDLKLAFAIADDQGRMPGRDESHGSQMVAKASGDGHSLSGSSCFVVDLDMADKAVVAARLDGQYQFFLVDMTGKGVSKQSLKWRDITRQVGQLDLDGAAGELLRYAPVREAFPFVRDRLHLVLAAENAAGIEQVLADAVAYAKERIAFGKPIGSFQAIKHQLAEIAGMSECATLGVQYAAWALSNDDPQAEIAAAGALSYSSEAYRAATYRNIQVFGAIGFTWEMKNHLYYKRARCNAELMGPPSRQREQVMQVLEARAASTSKAKGEKERAAIPMH